jgi:hypothetical protein
LNKTVSASVAVPSQNALTASQWAATVCLIARIDESVQPPLDVAKKLWLIPSDAKPLAVSRTRVPDEIRSSVKAVYETWH